MTIQEIKDKLFQEINILIAKNITNKSIERLNNVLDDVGKLPEDKQAEIVKESEEFIRNNKLSAAKKAKLLKLIRKWDVKDKSKQDKGIHKKAPRARRGKQKKREEDGKKIVESQMNNKDEEKEEKEEKEKKKLQTMSKTKNLKSPKLNN